MARRARAQIHEEPRERAATGAFLPTPECDRKGTAIDGYALTATPHPVTSVFLGAL